MSVYREDLRVTPADVQVLIEQEIVMIYGNQLAAEIAF